MSKQLVKKVVAGSLIVTTIATSTIEVQACDASAVMQTTNEISMMAGPLAPAVLLVGGTVAVGTGIVIGIRNRTTEKYEVYRSYTRLPDHWKKDSIIEKINPNGRVIQRRVYGKDGKPVVDYDLSHHNEEQYMNYPYGGIHKHIYNHKGQRGKGHPLTEQEYYQWVKNFDRSKADKMKVRYIEDNKKQQTNK